MRRTSTICSVTLLVVALSVASAGAFACQINCALTPAPRPMGHAGPCGGHAHMPGHDKGGQQHSGHTHGRIIAATHSGLQITTPQQTGSIPIAVGSTVAPAGVNHLQGSDIAAAKSSSLIFTTPVLRI